MNNPDQTLRGLYKPLLSLSQAEQQARVRQIRKERSTRPPTPPKKAKEPKAPTRRRQTPKDLDAIAEALLAMDPQARDALIARAMKEPD